MHLCAVPNSIFWVLYISTFLVLWYHLSSSNCRKPHFTPTFWERREKQHTYLSPTETPADGQKQAVPNKSSRRAKAACTIGPMQLTCIQLVHVVHRKPAYTIPIGTSVLLRL